MNKYKIGRVPLFSKVLLILISGLGIKLFFSCTPGEPIEMNYNNIEIIGIDNSGQHLYSRTKLDTIYADALAMQLTLTDTLEYYYASFLPVSKQGFSFQSALASSYDPTYTPINKVVEINVKTLYDINETLKGGVDISEYIFCPETNSRMYTSLRNGLEGLNGIQNSGGSSIQLILRPSVQNSKARFEVKVTLENGDELLCTSPLFSIIES